ncbi:MAG: hypothetical protein J0H40_08495 [Rhizobiales bacterium]|nr:hypothetical protein [Hyphomicrobiales bacterium]
MKHGISASDACSRGQGRTLMPLAQRCGACAAGLLNKDACSSGTQLPKHLMT